MIQSKNLKLFHLGFFKDKSFIQLILWSQFVVIAKCFTAYKLTKLLSLKCNWSLQVNINEHKQLILGLSFLQRETLDVMSINVDVNVMLMRRKFTGACHQYSCYKVNRIYKTNLIVTSCVWRQV